jgi:hypothetical protein
MRNEHSRKRDRPEHRQHLLAELPFIRPPSNVCSLAVIVVKGFCLSLLALSLIRVRVAVAANAALVPNSGHSISANEAGAGSSTTEMRSRMAPHQSRADFEGEPKSRHAERLADWVVDSGDNRGMPFAIVDKTDAKVFVFRADGQLRDAAPALVGFAKGDDVGPDIGNMAISQIRPDMRITQAGRFVSFMGYDTHGKEVLWLDYDSGLSIHRVINYNPKERRLQRLASPTPLDNRVSWGCINVPIRFFDDVVEPTFEGKTGIVYVLPETRSNRETFAAYYDVDRSRNMAVAHLKEVTKASSHR